MTEAGSTSPAGGSARGWLASPLFIAALPGVLVTIQVWIFAGGSTSVALVLIRNAQLFEVLAGSLVLVLQAVVILVTVYLSLNRSFRRHFLAQLEDRAILLILLIAAIPLLLLLPWRSLLVAVLVGGFALFLALLGSKFTCIRALSEKLQSNEVFDVVLGSIITVVLLFTNSFWLPLEEVTMQDGSRRSGYVVATTAEWTTLLSQSKQISYYVSSEVIARSVCESPPDNLLRVMQSGNAAHPIAAPC